MTAEKQGFSVALAENVQLAVGTRQRVDLTLQVGAITERLEVTAAATRLETDTSQRGQVITGEQTRALPLNGRDAQGPDVFYDSDRRAARGHPDGPGAKSVDR